MQNDSNGDYSDLASVRSEKTISDLTHGLSNLYPLPKKVENKKTSSAASILTPSFEDVPSVRIWYFCKLSKPLNPATPDILLAPTPDVELLDKSI